MAPDKFEKHIREKINEREIAPSEEAWNRIAGLIPVEERKRSRTLLRYSIAASFAGLLIVSLYLFQTRDEAVTPPVQVVETEQQLKEEPQPRKLLPVDIQEEEEQVASQLPTEQKKERVMEVGPETRRSLAVVAPEKAPAERDNVLSEKENTIAVVEKQEELLIQSKITEVVAEVRLLETNSEALTEAEVDSLLRKAHSEILKERIFTSNNAVDALALLNEVEEELDQSFRDQLFERLKAGFNKVRTAVADRNN